MSNIGIPSNNSIRHNLLMKFDQCCIPKPQSSAIAAIVTLAKSILLFIPYMIATTLDLLWWTVKTITVIDAYRTGIAHLVHLINILASYILGFALFVGVRQRTYKEIPDRSPILAPLQPQKEVSPPVAIEQPMEYWEYVPLRDHPHLKRKFEYLTPEQSNLPYKEKLVVVENVYQSKIKNKEPLYFDYLHTLFQQAPSSIELANRISNLIEKLVAAGANVNENMWNIPVCSLLVYLTQSWVNFDYKMPIIKTLIRLGAEFSYMEHHSIMDVDLKDEILAWCIEGQLNSTLSIHPSIFEHFQKARIMKTFNDQDTPHEQRFSLWTCLENGYLSAGKKILTHPGVIPKDEKEMQKFFSQLLEVGISHHQLAVFRYVVDTYGANWAPYIMKIIQKIHDQPLDREDDHNSTEEMLTEIRAYIAKTFKEIDQHPMMTKLKDQIPMIFDYLIPKCKAL